MTDYPSRLRISLVGAPDPLYSRSGSMLASGHSRIVIGQRGPYVEIPPELVIWDAFHTVPGIHRYYEEARSLVDDVKLYCQLERVDYADYLPGMCYVSPFDLYKADGGETIVRER